MARVPGRCILSPTDATSTGESVATSSILLVDADAAAAAEIVAALSVEGHTVVTVPDGDTAFRAASDHQLLVLDVLAGPGTPADVCREIRATPSLASIPVLCVAQTDDVEERIGFLEAGADDVVAKPVDARELAARVEALLLRFRRSRDLAPVAAPIGTAGPTRRRLVAVASPKGGVGATTISVNLAVVMAERRPGSVAILDLDLPFGQVATHLDLIPKQTLTDVLRDEGPLDEAEVFRTYLARHESGVHVLAAPGDPAVGVTPAQIERLLSVAADAFETVLVDAGSTVDPRSRAILDGVDVVLFPVQAEMASLNALHGLLDHLNASGTVTPKAMFVLNEMFAKELLKARDVEGGLGSKLTARIPYDAYLYLKAVNEGVPVVRGASRSAPAEAFSRLADTVFGASHAEAAAPAAVPDEKRPGRFAALLRR
jgi:pilus assembly protein CpaE